MYGALQRGRGRVILWIYTGCQFSMYTRRKRAYVYDSLLENTKIISMNGGFVSNAVCDTCTTVIPTEAGLKEKLEASLAETKLQQYRVTEENGQITIFAKVYLHMQVCRNLVSMRPV